MHCAIYTIVIFDLERLDLDYIQDTNISTYLRITSRQIYIMAKDIEINTKRDMGVSLRTIREINDFSIRHVIQGWLDSRKENKRKTLILIIYVRIPRLRLFILFTKNVSRPLLTK